MMITIFSPLTMMITTFSPLTMYGHHIFTISHVCSLTIATIIHDDQNDTVLMIR